VEIAVSRDRAGSFTPEVVAKRKRRTSGIDELVVSLTARGLTTGEIAAHLKEVYDIETSKETISNITDRVLDGMNSWRTRPLDPCYPVVMIDAIHVKIRDGQVANRPVYVALAVTCDGLREILGLWVGDGGEGAKFWGQVCTDLKNRGLADICILLCDGLKGLPEQVNTVWPAAVVQTCIIHRSRQGKRCWFADSGTMVCYADTSRRRRSTCPEIRGLASLLGRASAAIGACYRGPVARPRRGAPGRTAGRGQRDHRAQRRVRTRIRRQATAPGAHQACRRWPYAGRGR